MDPPKDTIWTRLKTIYGSRRSLKIQVWWLNPPHISVFLLLSHIIFLVWVFIFAPLGFQNPRFCHPIFYYILLIRRKKNSEFLPSQVLLWLWSNFLNSGSNWYLVWRDLKTIQWISSTVEQPYFSVYFFVAFDLFFGGQAVWLYFYALCS